LKSRMRCQGKVELLCGRSCIRTALGITLALVGFQSLAPAQQQNPSEAQVKAAYLLNFARLAEWPLHALPDGPSPFVICVHDGDEEFLKVVKSVIAGKMIGTHSLTVKPANSEDDLKSCHIIFYRGSVHKHAEVAIESLPKIGVLLVGEDESFLREGGMINLVRDHASVRFEVNPDAMDHSEIHFSSNVLAMAKSSYGVAPAPPSKPSVNRQRQLERSPAPEYSQLAQRSKLTGTVQVEAVVKPNGTVREVRILGGHPLLAEALASAVKQWKYQPSFKETTEIVKFNFTPQ
jgi:TonB family protein